MALSRTILLLRAYAVNASIVNATVSSSVITVNKNRKFVRDGHVVKESTGHRSAKDDGVYKI
jgi:hypothetical protein